LASDRREWIFVSDAHFTGQDPGEMEPFLRFLDSKKERMERLVILGDLFEFLFGFRESLWKQGSSWAEKTAAFSHYRAVLGKIRELWQQGIGLT